MQMFWILGIAMLLLAAPLMAQAAGNGDNEQMLEAHVTAALLDSSAAEHQAAMEAVLEVVSEDPAASDAHVALLQGDIDDFANETALLANQTTEAGVENLHARLLASSAEFNSDLNLSQNDTRLRDEIHARIQLRKAQMNQTLSQKNESAWNIARKGLLTAFDNRVSALQKAIDRLGGNNTTSDLQVQLDNITAMRAQLESAISSRDKNATKAVMQQVGDAIHALKGSLRETHKEAIMSKIEDAKGKCLNETNSTDSSGCLKHVERMENETQELSAQWQEKHESAQEKADQMHEKVQRQIEQHREAVKEKLAANKDTLQQRHEEAKNKTSEINTTHEETKNKTSEKNAARNESGGELRNSSRTHGSSDTQESD